MSTSLSVVFFVAMATASFIGWRWGHEQGWNMGYRDGFSDAMKMIEEEL